MINFWFSVKLFPGLFFFSQEFAGLFFFLLWSSFNSEIVDYKVLRHINFPLNPLARGVQNHFTDSSENCLSFWPPRSDLFTTVVYFSVKSLKPTEVHTEQWFSTALTQGAKVAAKLFETLARGINNLF